MRFILFTHPRAPDHPHANTHFLRGITRELRRLGHEVAAYRLNDSAAPSDAMRGDGDSDDAAAAALDPDQTFTLDTLDLAALLRGADVALVHASNPPALVARLGAHRRHHPTFRLFFHDTGHRAATHPVAMAEYDLSDYDGVLAFGDVLRQLYLLYGWADRAWTWHQAADTAAFQPHPAFPRSKPFDVVWVGHWDDERTEELHEFFLRPVRRLGLRAKAFGARYPEHARQALDRHGVEYGGELPNHRLPEAFAQAFVTVHVPRRPYARVLQGIPTLRPFEALACGMPLISAPWKDRESLFTPGQDFLMADDGHAMTAALDRVLRDASLARSLAEHGRQTILLRHTCAHRVAELLAILDTLEQERRFVARGELTPAPAIAAAAMPA